MQGQHVNRIYPLSLAIACAAIVLCSLAGELRADLLVYEPFDYDEGILTGQSGALGTTGEWSSHDTITDDLSKTQDWYVHEEGTTSGVGLSEANPSIEPAGMHRWDGTVANLHTTGGYTGLWGADDWDDPDGPNTGEPGRNLDAHIALAPSVTETFESETTTWFSYVAVRAWDRNEELPNLTIGTDPTPDDSRAASLTNSGSGIGTGGGPPRNNRPHIYPMYFQDGLPHNLFGAIPGWQDDAFTVLEDGRMDWQELDEEGYFGPVNIVVGRIEWDADTGGEDIISVVRFLESDELSEDVFEELIDARPNLSSANWEANKPDLDQSQFDVLNIAGLKFFVDEVRIATTFEEVVPIEDVVAAPRFRRGDANADGLTNLSDAVFVLEFLFTGGAVPTCLKSGDVNDSGGTALELTDPVLLLNYLFLGGALPPAPFEACGIDRTADGDNLTCDAFAPCA